jgi:CubicO group peptidase (beta-lactamase class C family)
MQDAMFERASQPTNDDLVAVLAEMDGPSTPPGDVFEYSNPGYELLGTVIERVSGQKFAEFMQARIFGPLGMTHTFSLPNEKRRSDPLVAMSYTGSTDAPEAYPSDDLDGLQGSGSIYTTVGDMALYDEALYAGTLLPVSALQDAFQPAQLNDGSTEPYGFGWELDESDGQSYVGHSGAWLGFNSDYVRLLDQHLSVIVLLNRDYDYPDDPRIGLKIAQFYLEP